MNKIEIKKGTIILVGGDKYEVTEILDEPNTGLVGVTIQNHPQKRKFICPVLLLGTLEVVRSNLRVREEQMGAMSKTIALLRRSLAAKRKEVKRG